LAAKPSSFKANDGRFHFKSAQFISQRKMLFYKNTGTGGAVPALVAQYRHWWRRPALVAQYRHWWRSV
jgi:hypothetical protein